MSIVEVNNVTKIFGPSPETVIPLLAKGWSKERILKETKHTVGVNQVSFSIEAGEIFVIMGLSGSGKSTLVRLLNRLIDPTSGSIRIHGRDIVRMDGEQLRQLRRKQISMVFQKFALFPHRTVIQNVEFGLEIQGVGKQERRAKAMEALTLVGLEGYADSLPAELSGGMQQRVGLARALANDPDILLMDEAFSALDPLIRRDMQDELIQLQNRMRKTIVFITHDLDEALRLGDRILLMKDGSVVQIGTPEDILMNPANDYVERFIENVDRSKVLTASHVMIRPETITPDKGPRVAMHLMKQNNISNLFVVDRERKLLGVITAEGASAAVREGKPLEDILIRDIPTVSPDRVVNELFELCSNSKVPVAVVDDSRKLLGILIRGSLLGGLSGSLQTNGGRDELAQAPVG